MTSSSLAQVVEVPGQQHYDGGVFPLAIGCANPHGSLDDAIAWIRAARGELLEQAARHGAILFRGFPIHTPEDFDAWIAAFGLENFPYEESLSNAVRVNYTPRVFSANEAPADVRIYLHHEMAQTPIFPARLFFFCQTPATQGGATPLCRSDVLWTRIERECPEFARKCELLGLRYTNVMPAANDAQSGMGRSWQSTLRASTPAEAEARLQSLGYSWQWLPDGCLRATTPRLPAIREISAGRKVFFNQLIAAFQGWKDTRNDPSKAITFGDGTPLDRDAARRVADMAETLTFDMAWQHGDVVLVDNLVAMHGRRTFQGQRKVLASLADPRRHELRDE